MENIIEKGLREEVSQDYIDYSMSVICQRALPDVRDGLKPVQRRILYAMKELGLTPDKPHRKSARIVGDTMGKYHPHGDTSIYGALVVLAQEWGQRYPFIDGHGNFGSIDGDSAAAMRYTEARFSKIATLMLTDINKDVVDFIPNFDETEEEPAVLPSRIPNIFINGTTGIAVGMACNTAPYNLEEVVAGITAYLQNEKISMEEMMQYIPAPDFPTGCEIINQSELCKIMGTGVGKIKLRAKYEVEQKGKKNYLIFTEIPYQVNKARLLENICEKINTGRLEGISDVKDESGKKNIRICFELKKDMIPESVAQQLYNKTDLQVNFSLKNTLIVNGVPRTLSLLDMMKEYVNFQLEVLTRRTKTEIRIIENRLEIVKGLIKAVENIDNIVAIIKSSKNTTEAGYLLQTKYDLTENQTKAILDMKLSKLTGLEITKLYEEEKSLKEEFQKLKELLEDDSKMKNLLTKELNESCRCFHSPRRTRVYNLVSNGDKDLVLVAKEDVVVSYSTDGYIKSVRVSDYKLQNRGGQGINNGESIIKTAIITNTTNNLLVVTDQGTVFSMPVRNIPKYKNNQKGISILNLLPLENEKVCSIVDMTNINKPYIVFTTKQGLVKKSSSDLYRKFRANGSKGITLREGDRVIDVSFAKEEQLFTMFSISGKSITFNLKDINPIGKTGIGVKGMKILEGEEIIGASCCELDDSYYLFSSKGFGKRLLVNLLTVQSRGGKGIIAYKVTSKTGGLRSVNLAKNSMNKILVVGDNKSITISCGDLPAQGRATSGVTVMRGSEIQTTVLLGD